MAGKKSATPRRECEHCGSRSRHKPNCPNYRIRAKPTVEEFLALMKAKLEEMDDDKLGAFIKMAMEVGAARAEKIREATEKKLEIFNSLIPRRPSWKNREEDEEDPSPTSVRSIAPPAASKDRHTHEGPGGQRVCGAVHPKYPAIKCRQPVDDSGKHEGMHYNRLAASDAKSWN